MNNKLYEDIYSYFILSGKDTRYTPEGYGFVLASLDYIRDKDTLEGHVEAEVVITGVMELSTMKYGPIAENVLNNWGITSPNDIGTIVYNLIEMGILSRTSDDKLEDFYIEKSFSELLSAYNSYKIDKKKLQLLKDS